MHPAVSIIIFTTLSGFGYGLAGLLGLGILDPAAIATKIAHVLALMLIGGGLLSSTLHLGNPQRAWRAFSQWRSSWLSREGVLAVMTFLPLGASAWLCVFEGRYAALPGLLGTAGCIATVYCTSMIYASLRSIDTWYSWMTPACYLLFATAGGLLLGSIAALMRDYDSSVMLTLPTIAAVAAVWTMKAFWWRRLRTLAPRSTPESATGLGEIGAVRLFERPHVNDNYLTREMGYRIARKHAVKLSRFAILYGGVAPAVLLALVPVAGQGAPAFLFQVGAALLFGLGVAIERWLFFAEARHAVMNYY